MNSDIDNIRKTLEMIEEQTIQKIVSSIHDSKKVFVIGNRSSSVIANYLGFYLNFIVDDVHVIPAGPNEAFDQLINISEEDSLIVISFLDYFNEVDADIFCIQETKCQEGQVELDLPGYHQYWNYAERKGYSGTAIFTKKEPLKVTYDIGVDHHDREGRVITLEFEDYYIITCYTPNSKRGLERLDDRMEFEDEFKDYLLELGKTKPVIMCGDLNVAHEEIDLKNPKTNA